MPESSRKTVRRAQPSLPREPLPAAPASPAGALYGEPGPAPLQPTARFFGVPFLRGAAAEVTAIHLCPERVHLATIRDGHLLEVANRLTLKGLDLGDLADAHRIAFRPESPGGTTELAIVGPAGKPDIARLDVAHNRRLPSLTFAGATALGYRHDGKFIAAGDAQGRVRVWHLGGDRPTLVLAEEVGAGVISLAFQAEHPTLYATLADGSLAEVALAPCQAAPAAQALAERAPGMGYDRIASGRSGYSIYLAGRDQRVYVVDTATGEVGVFAPRVGPVLDLRVLDASGYLAVLGTRSVYLLHTVGPTHKEHLALVCPFEEQLYALWELERDLLLVFHAAD